MGHWKNKCWARQRAEAEDKGKGKDKAHVTWGNENYYQDAFMLVDQISGKGNYGRDAWYIDSAVPRHYCTDRKSFNTYQRLDVPRKVRGYNGGFTNVIGVGTVELYVAGEGKSCGHITVGEVYHAPKGRGNLLSVKQLIRKGIDVHFGKNGMCRITKNGRLLAKALEEKNIGLFQLVGKPVCKSGPWGIQNSRAEAKRTGIRLKGSKIGVRSYEENGIKMKWESRAKTRNKIKGWQTWESGGLLDNAKGSNWGYHHRNWNFYSGGSKSFRKGIGDEYGS